MHIRDSRHTCKSCEFTKEGHKKVTTMAKRMKVSIHLIVKKYIHEMIRAVDMNERH